MALLDRGDKKSVWVVTAKSTSGREYLKAETDWVQPVTLLALPDLPIIDGSQSPCRTPTG